MADDAQIVLRAYTAQLDTDLKQATGSVQKFADSMRSSLTGVGTQWKTIPVAANEVDKSLGGLMGTLKNFKADQVQQARSARFFANEIAGIVPMSGAASGALQGLLAAGFELGSGITKVALGFAAFELAKVALGLVGEETKIVAGQMQALGNLGKIHTDVLRAGMESVHGATRDATAIQAAYNATMAAGAGELRKYDVELKKVADAGISTWAKLNDIFGDGSLRQAYSETLGAIRAKAEASTKALRGLADEAARLATQKQWMEEANREQTHRDEMERQADAQRADQVKKAKEAIQEIAQAQAAAWTAMELGNLGPGNYGDSMKSQPAWMQNAGAVGRLTTGEQADSYSKVELDMAGPFDPKESAARAAAIQKEGQVYVQLASQLGDVFGKIATGQMSIIAGIKQMISGMVQVVAQAMIELELAIAVAAAKAAGSVSIIPFVGPALGIAAAAAMFSALMAYTPSAATGWDKLPSDQLVQAHKGERILTAYDTERMDRLEAGGRATNVYITAVDAKSVERLFRENDGALIRTLNRAAGEGRYQ